MAGRLSGKVCIITGSGGSMGRAAAILFASEGARVIGCDVNVESAVLTKTVTINFFPNSYDVSKKVAAKTGGGEVLYDPNVDTTIEEIAKLAGQFGAARIQISGHTDASMRGVAVKGRSR